MPGDIHPNHSGFQRTARREIQASRPGYPRRSQPEQPRHPFMNRASGIPAFSDIRACQWPQLQASSIDVNLGSQLSIFAVALAVSTS
jgi:hypothetical protein